MLTAAEVTTTGEVIAAVQLEDGMIPWFPAGHADPWNHVEAAMALTVAGRRLEAERAYEWLARIQRPDGAWHQYYRDSSSGAGPLVEVALLDANVTAYVATGAWHHYLATDDAGFLESIWPAVDRAMGFVLGLQARGGEVIWARHADGTPWSFALLTASSSTCFSLRCAAAIAARVGHDRPQWRAAVARLASSIAHRPQAFLPKDRWAMDWYYPVLTGIVGSDVGRQRLAAGRGRFVLGGHGVRCVADRPWVTTAETCEAALAHWTVGEEDEAIQLFSSVRYLRAEDGSYFTGMVHPEGVHFPAGERTTYSAAAAILAADALSGLSRASGLFRGAGLAPLRFARDRAATASAASRGN